MMKILTLYLLKKFFVYFFIVLFSLEFFFVGIDFLQNIKSLPNSANLQLLYLLYNSFFTLTLTLPLSLCFAWIITLVVLIKNNELTAFLSLGVKPKHLYSPIIMVSTGILFVMILFEATPMAYSYTQKNKILDNQYFVNSKHDFFVKYNEYFVYIKKLFPLQKRAEGIEIFKIRNQDIVETISAPKAYFQNNRWYIIDAKIMKKPEHINWQESKLIIHHEKFLHILEGFKPKILDNVYDVKSSYSIQDALYAFSLLREQNINTNTIRSSLYYKLFAPFFVIPMILFIYHRISINSRFFHIGLFITTGVFSTLVVWGIFFMLHKFSSGGLLTPEVAILLPLVIWFTVIVLFNFKWSQYGHTN